MKWKENTALVSGILIVILITFKIWIKFTFEIQLLGLVLLIMTSWILKYFIIKAVKKRNEKKKADREAAEAAENNQEDKQ